MPTWSEEYLQRLTKEAEREISRDLNPVWDRYPISITAGTATYTLPNYIRGITGIKWKGEKIDPLYQTEMSKIDYSYLTTQGAVRWYLRSPEDFQVIRFVSVPNETIAANPTTDDLFDSTVIANRVVISFYREPDTAGDLISLPDYIARRLVKSYVLYRAFKREGKGQDLQASQYYQSKYIEQLANYRSIIARYTMSKQGISGLADYADLYNDMPRLQRGFNITPGPYALHSGSMQESIDNYGDALAVSLL